MIINALDRQVISINQSPPSFKKEIVSRVTALAVSILMPLEAGLRIANVAFMAAVYLIVSPIDLAVRTIKHLINPDEPTEFWEAEKRKLMISIVTPVATAVTAVANCVLSPVVALISPKTMIELHIESGLTTLPDPPAPPKPKTSQSGIVSKAVKESIDDKFLRFHIDIQTKKELELAGLTPPTSIALYGPSTAANESAATYITEKMEKKIRYAYIDTAKDVNDLLDSFNIENELCFIDMESIEKKIQSTDSDIEKIKLRNRVKILLKGLQDLGANYILSSKKPPVQQPLDLRIQINVPLPDSATRTTMLQKGLSKDNIEENFDFAAVSDATEGAKIKKIEKFITGIKQRAFDLQSKVTTDLALKVARLLNPKASEEIEKPDDFVGMEELHEKFNNYLEVLKNPEQAREFDVKLPAGMLLYGPPGCGKTYTAKHLPRYAKSKGVTLNFRQIKSSDITSKWVGETVLNIRRAFEEAKKAAPSILFIDECEGLFPSRAKLTGSSGYGAAKTEELDEMLQLIEEAKEHNVIVVAATNYLPSVDPAIIRTGRFDYTFEVKPPDAATRLKLFEAKLRQKKCEPNLDLKALVAPTKGFTASDVETIANDVALVSWKKRIPITLDLLMTSIAEVKNKKASAKQMGHNAAQTLDKVGKEPTVWQ